MNMKFEQDLSAGGCVEKTVQMPAETEDPENQIRLLRQCRKEQLNRVHAEQQRLQELDIMIYELKKERSV